MMRRSRAGEYPDERFFLDTYRSLIKTVWLSRPSPTRIKPDRCSLVDFRGPMYLQSVNVLLEVSVFFDGLGDHSHRRQPGTVGEEIPTCYAVIEKPRFVITIR